MRLVDILTTGKQIKTLPKSEVPSLPGESAALKAQLWIRLNEWEKPDSGIPAKNREQTVQNPVRNPIPGPQGRILRIKDVVTITFPDQPSGRCTRKAGFPGTNILVPDLWDGWIRKSASGLTPDSGMGNRPMVQKSKMKGEQRLMNANEAAEYLGLSYWTLRDLIWSGAIPLVQLPNKNGRLRRILVDKNDLDRLIEQSKDTG
jgi:excisionase family DNA binding protein